jgi:hypothetical protein
MWTHFQYLKKKCGLLRALAFTPPPPMQPLRNVSMPVAAFYNAPTLNLTYLQKLLMDSTTFQTIPFLDGFNSQSVKPHFKLYIIVYTCTLPLLLLLLLLLLLYRPFVGPWLFFSIS